MLLFRDGEVLMFDCGEGTQTQLAKSSVRPGGISSVFLTHFHGDHVNGLPGLIGSFTLNQREEVLDIVGPKGMRRWFKTLRDLHILWPGFDLRVNEVEGKGIVMERDGFHVEAVGLRHRITAWGYSYIEQPRPGRFDVEKAKALGVPHGPLFGKLQRGESVETPDGTVVEPHQVLGPSRPGLKITYCTDTAPCDGAVELAKDADILIHESTYPGGDEKLAHSRGHSTASDAARTAKAAGAKKLVLTHLSQKYPRTDIFVEHARKIFEETIAAHDLLELDVDRREC